MKIKNMTATFGRLDRATLTPGEGLTVITSPNEGGKSTWAGFLKAMLYGIDTRERDRTGFLADKTRYQPWSGAPMAGELRLEWQGQDITLRRSSSKGHSFGGFEAVYTASGDPVPGLTASNAGQALTGVSRDVFIRTAMVGQNAAMVTAAPELEQRIAALATSGQEDVSYSATQRTLKDWRNRRRSNRANGLIPELESELARTQQALRDMELARRRQAEAAERLAQLDEEKAALTAEKELHCRLAQKDLNRRCAQALADWQAAKAAIPSTAPHPIFGTMTGEEAWAFAQAKTEERKAAEAENRRLQEERTCAERLLSNAKACLAVAPAFAVAFLAFALTGVYLKGLAYMAPPMIFAAVACIVLICLGLSRRKAALAVLAGPVPVEAPDGGDLLTQAADYRQRLAQAQQARLAADAAKQRLDDLTAQGGQPVDTLEFLTPPARSAGETNARLSAVESEILRWRSQLDQAIGAFRDDPLALEAQAGQLEEQLSQRALQYDALVLALTALETANNTLRQRFSPALNQAAGEIFARLTGQRYRQLSLSRDFSAQTGPADGMMARSALYLSAGTISQLYLAVRLAMCRLMLPGVPILLDDALADFDDSRMAMAMDCLKELGKERQVLLFSCHGREARWAEEHGAAVLTI